MSAKKSSNSNKKSGGAGFIVTLLLLSWLTNFSFSGIIIGVLLGLGIGKITSIMGSGLDTTTHNKRDLERQKKEEELRRQEDEKKQQEAERIRREAEKEAERKRQEDASRIPLTGNEAADAVITKGTEMLRTIRAENEAIPDVVLSGQMESLCQKCEQIFRTVSDSPSKAPQVRKFMSYYLPTTLKMLANYRMMQQRGVSYLEMNQARETTIRGMNISTDIEVLEQMLKRDGYTENELTGIKDVTTTARTAAEAQMRASSVPVMNFPSEDTSSDTSSSHDSAAARQ